jgi:hypothetical protein
MLPKPLFLAVMVLAIAIASSRPLSLANAQSASPQVTVIYEMTQSSPKSRR